MKNLSKVLAIILTSGISVSAFASTSLVDIKPKNSKEIKSNTTVSVFIGSVNEAKNFKVAALNESKNPVTITIYDREGIVVFTEELSSEQINRTYNIAALPSATYTVIVSSENFSTYKEIVVK